MVLIWIDSNMGKTQFRQIALTHNAHADTQAARDSSLHVDDVRRTGIQLGARDEYWQKHRGRFVSRWRSTRSAKNLTINSGKTVSAVAGLIAVASFSGAEAQQAPLPPVTVDAPVARPRPAASKPYAGSGPRPQRFAPRRAPRAAGAGRSGAVPQRRRTAPPTAIPTPTPRRPTRSITCRRRANSPSRY